MKKLQSLIVLLILILTIFSSFSFIPQPASASPANLAYSDTAYENASVSYYNRSTAVTNPSANAVTITGTETPITENMSFSSPTYVNSAETVAYYNYSLSTSVFSGVGFSISLWGITGTWEGLNSVRHGNINHLYVNLTVGGNVQTVSYAYDYTQAGLAYFNFSESNTFSFSGTLTEISVAETGTSFTYSPTDLYSESSVTTTGITKVTFSHSTPINLSSYYAYSGSYSSSFSSQIPSNLASFKIYWSAQEPSTATYDGTQYTSSPITGAIGTYSISFSSQNSELAVSSYTATYNISATYYVYTLETQTKTTSTSYSVLESADGIYFNASFSFSLSFSSSSLYVSSSYPISWGVNISHLLNEYYSAPYNSISYAANPSNYFHATYGSDSTNFFDFIFYYNSSSSSADSMTFTVQTSELVNYYPGASYYSLYYSGHGSTETLVVNATNHFNNETLQVSDVNWGDGSPTQSSPVETPVDRNYYNFSLSHQYSATGTYTVTFLIVNAVGNQASLSSSGNRTITLTISTSFTSNALPVHTNTHIYFNYSQVNVNVQTVKLYVDNILAQTNNTTSNTNFIGSITYVIPYYLTQTAEFTVLWEWYAGGISESQSIQYSVANSVPTVGKWVILNYTIGTGSTAVKESVPYFYTQQITHNVSWSYFVWQISLPSNAVNISVKGNPSWESPIISVPADFNTTTSTFILLENISQFQVTWLAPNPIGNALIVMEYYPESAVFGLFGVTIPFNDFNTFLNGKQIYSPTQQVNLGETVTINTTTTFGKLLSSYTTTVSEQTQFLEIPLNIVPLTVDNMNSSYVIGMQVSQGSTSQSANYLMPLQSETFYVPAGTYNFSFMYLNFNSYAVVKYLNLSMTVSTVSYYIITGVTLTQINYHILQTEDNVSNLVENVNISLSNSNSKIYNETLVVKSDITNTNSSVIKQVLDENTTINNIYSKVSTINSDIQVIQNNILSDVNSTRINITTRETTIKDLVSLSLQEENSTFSYQLKFGTPSVQGETYEFPVFVTLFNGQMANLSVTQQAWQNLKLYYVTGNSTYPLNFSVSNEQAGSFVINIYNVTPAMAAGISSGQGLITAQGEVKEGVLTNLAAGIIGSQQVQYSSSSLWTDIFGIQPPSANDSVSGMFQYLSWLDESYAGRAIYMIVVLSALTYYLVMINMKLEERRKKK
jgi:hypothetical protein